ncbi:hypothetical protein [Xenorhabdus cabanillasii]|uniref:hypothetical protein n=1 Tax=Xenorhabdus cabanillasii TaxID=351673 RepID=UPI001E453BA1|nr:hypothetical protein [Xenorhabdus cabanillasii]
MRLRQPAAGFAGQLHFRDAQAFGGFCHARDLRENRQWQHGRKLREALHKFSVGFGADHQHKGIQVTCPRELSRQVMNGIRRA